MPAGDTRSTCHPDDLQTRQDHRWVATNEGTPDTRVEIGPGGGGRRVLYARTRVCVRLIHVEKVELASCPSEITTFRPKTNRSGSYGKGVHITLLQVITSYYKLIQVTTLSNDIH